MINQGEYFLDFLFRCLQMEKRGPGDSRLAEQTEMTRKVVWRESGRKDLEAGWQDIDMVLLLL